MIVVNIFGLTYNCHLSLFSQQTEDEKDLEYAFFGIYDGHGGREASQYAKVLDKTSTLKTLQIRRIRKRVLDIRYIEIRRYSYASLLNPHPNLSKMTLVTIDDVY
jgi:serine/threonine protein phosphatase PrpC